MSKPIKEIRNELLEAYLRLEDSYYEGPTTTDPEKRISYLEIQFCEHLLNAMKALEYHYREDVPEMRTFKRENEVLKNTRKLLKKYGENSDPENSFSPLQLQRKFDTSGYLEHRDFFEAAAVKREELKKNFRK